jgi:hypothetical protein
MDRFLAARVGVLRTAGRSQSSQGPRGSGDRCQVEVVTTWPTSGLLRAEPACLGWWPRIRRSGTRSSVSQASTRVSKLARYYALVRWDRCRCSADDRLDATRWVTLSPISRRCHQQPSPPAPGSDPFDLPEAGPEIARCEPTQHQPENRCPPLRTRTAALARR